MTKLVDRINRETSNYLPRAYHPMHVLQALRFLCRRYLIEEEELAGADKEGHTVFPIRYVRNKRSFEPGWVGFRGSQRIESGCQ